jgi:bifunctional non-homologous end joining protein LigD
MGPSLSFHSTFSKDERMRPMLATRADHVPTGAEWTHEVKWDGMRVLVTTGGPRARFVSRNDNDVSVSFPELHQIGAGRDLLLDGEVVAFRDGRPSFAALAERMHVSQAVRAAALAEVTPVTLLLFDVLRVDGRDLTREPLSKRRRILEGLDLADVHWQVPATYDDGPMLLQATDEQGLEGIVSKRLNSRYEPGIRSKHWLKFPHRRSTSWVIGGWRPETDSAHRLGAVLVGRPTADGLLYMGRVGSGIAGKVGPMLLEQLTPRATSPFVDEVPRLDALGTHWVEPLLVVDVESLGLSGQGRLRQPSYRGLRSDLTPADLEDQS